MTHHRSMQLTDLSQILAIEQSVQLAPWAKQHFIDCLNKDHYYCRVIASADTVYGFAVFSIIADEAELLNIAIDKPYQKKGLAKTMLHDAILFLSSQGCAHLLLEVRASNDVARQLYTSLGFQQNGYRKSYYPSPEGREDAILMTLALKK